MFLPSDLSQTATLQPSLPVMANSSLKSTLQACDACAKKTVTLVATFPVVSCFIKLGVDLDSVKTASKLRAAAWPRVPPRDHFAIEQSLTSVTSSLLSGEI